MMTRAVKIQRYEALLKLLQDFAEEPGLENGDATVVSECISLVRGRLKGLR